MTFSLKQLINRTGSMNMEAVDRLLDSTSISATDVETGQTLLETACRTNNLSLAKFCYRKGADLNLLTANGETPFNIAVQRKSYRMMECLRMYGVKVNSCDTEGRTGLHVATSQNDIDAICRLIEWGADVNARDKHMRTPLHYAAIAGNVETAMFLLEIGADLNAMDDKEYTAVAHAEANDRFALMDRLVMLGGRGHRLHEEENRSDSARPKYGVDESQERSVRFKSSIGDVKISPLYLRKNSSLNRLGKYASTPSLFNS
jgi:ankyrin repeat protein